MGNKKLRQHTIDFIFPIALFFVFAASALVALLLSANIYRHITEASETNFTTGTSLSYITEKIRQCDENGAISEGTFDGREALIIEQNFNDAVYHTYIYEDDGTLRELFIQEGVEASAENGTEIMEVNDFGIEMAAPGVFRFTCTTRDGNTETALVSIHTQPERANEGSERR